MPALPAIVIGLLVSPSTWLLIVIFFLFSIPTTASHGTMYFLAWFLVIGIGLHAIRELAKDIPWLGRSSPPPGLRCTPHEWDSEFVGKPLFAVQLLCLTIIRGMSLFILFNWMIRT